MARRAAQYLRMSTDTQRDSLARQAEAIAAYAAAHGLQLVRSFEDPGVSGLTAAARPGLQALLAQVVGGAADFEVVLVHDVSRWGRFQNPDEAAHYEFVCRQAGIEVLYCAEPFTDCDPVSAALLKQVRRVMAGEYSRRLSQTVRRAQAQGAAAGCWQGGPCGYGHRRVVVDAAGRVVAQLERGEAKALQGQRVRLVPGPDAEVATVRRIYDLFVRERLTRTAIARRLNAERVPYGDDRPWSFQKVQHVLTDPAYAGDLAFGKLTYELGGPGRRRAPADWTLAADAVTPLVSREAQAEVRRRLDGKGVSLSDDEMLACLRGLLDRRGRLTASIIRNAPGVPHPASFHNRFGSLAEAYRRIGYAPPTRRGRRPR